MKLLAAVVLGHLLLVTACGEPAALPGGAASQPAAQTSAAGKELLTGARLGQYMIYQREMAPHTKELLELGMKAIGRSSSEAAKDPSLLKAAEYEAAALQKSGLSRAEAMELSRIVSQTVMPRAMGSDESKQRARDAFEREYGKDAAAALLQYEAELVENQRQLIKAMTQK